MKRRGVASEQITGIDLAKESELSDAFARVKRGLDFLGWSQRTTMRFDRVVANPPYLAIRELTGVLLENALKTVVPTDGNCVPHRANCWYAFLCASISLLKENGSLAFVLPAAWDYADYAESLRTGIPRLFASVKCYRSVHPLFSGVKKAPLCWSRRATARKNANP